MSLTKEMPQMGIVQCTSLVIGNMVGAGIFTLPILLVPFGSISLIGWLVTTIGAICLSLVHARLSEKYPQTGGPYVYAKHAFGRFAAFQVGWTYWISNGILGNVSLAIAIAANLTVLYPQIQSSILVQLSTTIGILWVVTFINGFGVAFGGRVQVFFTVAKILPLLSMSLYGLFYVDWQFIFPLKSGKFTPLQSILGSAAATLYTFVGLESSTIPAENVRCPEKTIPASTIIGTGITALFYILSTLVLMGLLSQPQLALSTSPFSDAGALLFGPQAGVLFGFFAAMSAMGTLNGMVLLQGQMPYAAAKDNLFPKMFAYLSPRGVPAVGLYLSSLIITLFLLAGQGLS